GLDPSASIADAFAAKPLRAARAYAGVLRGGRLAVPFMVSRRSRVQVRRVRCTLASCRPSSRLERCAAACRFPVSGNPARSLELAMAHDLFSSLDFLVSGSAADVALMVRDVAGDYRLADA